MKITVNKKQLIDELTIAKKITSGAKNLAILSSAIITITPQSVYIETTDLENARVGIIGENPYRIYNTPKYHPSILVPVEPFMKAVKAIPKKCESVSLEILENGNFKINDRITIECGQSLDDYPVTPDFPHRGFAVQDFPKSQPRGFKVFDSKILSQVLASRSGGKDERRSHIIGLYLDFKSGEVAGTDGNRLHISKMLNGHGAGLYEEGVIIPRTFANLLMSPQLKNDIGNLTITDQYAFVETGTNGFVYTRLLEGEYPDYHSIWRESSFTNVLSVQDKQILIESIKEASAIMSQDYWSINFNLGSGFEIASVNPEIGKFDMVLENEHYAYVGSDIDAWFNPSMLIAAINATEDKGVNAYFRDAENPIWIQSNDRSFNAFVMPIRV